MKKEKKVECMCVGCQIERSDLSIAEKTALWKEFHKFRESIKFDETGLEEHEETYEETIERSAVSVQLAEMLRKVPFQKKHTMPFKLISEADISVTAKERAMVEEIQIFFASNLIDIDLLCSVAWQISDVDGGDGSFTRRAEDLLIEKLLELPGVAVDDALALSDSFETKTGRHRTLTVWVKKYGVNSEQEGKKLLDVVMGAKGFYAKEARNAIRRVIDKSVVVW